MHITFTEKQLINYFVDGQEEACIEVFLSEGPDGLRKYLGIPEDREDVFQSVYDYFLFERGFSGAFLTRVSCNVSKLLQIFHSEGPDAVRYELHLVGSEYDDLWMKVLDVLLDHYSLQQLNERQKSHVGEFFGRLRKSLLKNIL